MGIIDTTSNVVQGLANIAARGSEALTNATPSPAPLEIDPGETGGAIADKLEDFRIPQGLRDLLTPSLTQLGFEIKTITINSMPGLKPGSGDLIQNGAGGRSILHLPRRVLEDQLVWQSVGLVIQRLQFNNQVLLIVSEGLESAHVFFNTVGKQLWLKHYSVTVNFLPWTHLIPNVPMAESDRLTVLPALLQLEDLISAARSLPAVNKTPLDVTAEVTNIGDILGPLPVFVDGGEPGWRIFMTRAGLAAIVGDLNFSGTDSTMRAISVIRQLKDRRPLADRPGEQVLGLFLRQVLEIPDLKPVDGDKIREIINTYNL